MFFDELLFVDLISSSVFVIVLHLHVPLQVVLAREYLLTHFTRENLRVLEVRIVTVFWMSHQMLC